LLLSGALVAQEEDASMSPAHNFLRNEVPQHLMTSGNHTYLVSQLGNSIRVRPHDEPYNIFDVKLPDFHRTLQSKVIDSLLFVWSEKDETTLTVSTYAISDNGVILKGAREFHNELEQRKSKIEWYKAISPDGSVAVVCSQRAFDKTSKANIKIQVHNADSLFEEQLKLPFDSDDIAIIGATVDNAGTVYLAATSGIKINSPFQRKYLIYAFHPSNKELHEFDLSAEDLYIQEMVLKPYGDELLACALYTTNPLAETESEGIVHFSISTLGTTVKQRGIRPFAPDMIEVHEGIEERNSGEIDQLFISDLILTGKESLVVLETRYQDQLCMADPRTGIVSCSDQFHFKAISIIDLQNPNKTTSIGKRQMDYESKTAYTGGVIAYNNQGYFALYNDHFKNESLKAERVMTSVSRSKIRYVWVPFSAPEKAQTGFLTPERQSAFGFTPHIHPIVDDQNIFVVGKTNNNYVVKHYQTEGIIED